MRRGLLAALGLTVAASVASSGCMNVLVEGTIKSTRQGARAINTMHDFEGARAISYAGLGQLEGMHRIAPESANALAALTRAWGGVAFAFIQDDYELALEREDEEAAMYHQARERAAYQRAQFYGEELLGYMGSDFDEAKKNAETLRLARRRGP